MKQLLKHCNLIPYKRRSYFFKPIIFTVLLYMILLSFSSCFNFNTADINLQGITLSDVSATSSSAYFLATDGTLYCTGADPDAGDYVVYQNKDKCIVATDVKEYGTTSGGGYYINNSNELYIWNRNPLPIFNYNETGTHTKILENVKSANFYTNSVLYIDTSNNLYFANESDNINKPMLIDNDVADFCLYNHNILWIANGTLNFLNINGDTSADIEQLKAQLSELNLTNINATNNYITFLADNNLWFYGDYDNFISGYHNNHNSNPTNELKLLKDDILSMSCAYNTILATDSNNSAYLWGRCISNGIENTSIPEFDFFENLKIADNVKSIYTSDGFVCYIDNNDASQIYHAGGWTSFYGNSTSDEYVGVNREPVTWVSK